MKDEKQIEEMARDIFEPRVAIDGIDIAFAAVHGADRDAENHFMRIAGHLYEKCWRKQEWISVEDRLPDNHRMVLVVCESTSISAGALIAIGSYGGGFWSLGGADGTLYLTKYMQFVVSHWMELPEMPKMKGGK